MKKIDNILLAKLRQIKFLGLDFDGVLTDGKVVLQEDGKESVVCSRKDGFGLNLLKNYENIKISIISSETNRVVLARCQKLKIECVGGELNKLNVFKKILDRENIQPNEAAFIGDDLNDVECLLYAGIAFTVNDAHQSCKDVADYVTVRAGGDHAVREVCDLILAAREGAKNDKH